MPSHNGYLREKGSGKNAFPDPRLKDYEDKKIMSCPRMLLPEPGLQVQGKSISYTMDPRPKDYGDDKKED
jgi:hypothetical protein